MLQCIVRLAGSLLGCLVVTVGFAGEGADQPLPATPQIGGFSAIESVYEPATSSPATVGPIAEISGVPMGACVSEPVTTCGQPVVTDCGYGSGHQGNHCGKMHKKHWCCIHSTGDMYPHFPYYPEHHGYYYFRPYNYTNVLLHQSQGLQLGVNPGNPYSVSMLNPLFEQFALTNISRDDDYDRLPPQRDSLPKLEDLLERK